MTDDLSLNQIRELVDADLPRKLDEQVSTIHAVTEAWPEPVTSLRDLQGQVTGLLGCDPRQPDLQRFIQTMDIHEEVTLREALSRLLYLYAPYPPDTSLDQIVPEILEKAAEFL